MSSVTFSQKTAKVLPPDKGSFPLDHKALCKNSMLEFMDCLNKNDYDSTKCRSLSLKYLECRMSKNLMAREDLENLGFADFKKSE